MLFNLFSFISCISFDGIPLIIDKNKDCEYNYGWGVVVFKPIFMKYMQQEDLHVGYSMQRYLSDNKNYRLLNIQRVLSL